MLCPKESGLHQQIETYLNHEERFPIRLIETTDSFERCRSLVNEVFPHIVLLVDVHQDPDWSSKVLQLSKDINLDQQNATTVILTSTQDLEVYYEKALNAGARGVVKVERYSENMLGALGGEIERSILQAYDFIRNKQGWSAGLPASIKTITMVSGKGGVGKSVIATALAGEIARRQQDKRIVLVDLDMQFGAVAPMLQLEPAANLAKLAPIATEIGQKDINDFLTVKALEKGNNIYVLAAPDSPSELPALSPESAAEILFSLRRSSDYVLIDLPTQITDASLAAFQASDLILIICEPEILSVRASRQLLDLLENDPTLGNPSAQIRMIINKKQPNSRRSRPVVDMKDVHGLFPDLIIAEFPYDPTFIDEHIASGELIGSWAKNNRFLRELKRLYKRMGLENSPTLQPQTEESIDKTESSGPISRLFNSVRKK